MLVSKGVTIAAVESELPAADAYARRHGWGLNWFKDDLVLVADGKHPADQRPLRLRADLAEYRAMPPAWMFLQLDENGDAKPSAPKPGSLPTGGGSIFHSTGVICAPYNRLAYSEHGGPHGDWSGPASWLNVRGVSRATNLADMLSQITIHLRYSPGWQ